MLHVVKMSHFKSYKTVVHLYLNFACSHFSAHAATENVSVTKKRSHCRESSLLRNVMQLPIRKEIFPRLTFEV